jgi:hypothetical protein
MFIRLTSKQGELVYFNVAHIVTFFRRAGEDRTSIVDDIGAGGLSLVAETPEQIANGIEALDIRISKGC